MSFAPMPRRDIDGLLRRQNRITFAQRTDLAASWDNTADYLRDRPYRSEYDMGACHAYRHAANELRELPPRLSLWKRVWSKLTGRS